MGFINSTQHRAWHVPDAQWCWFPWSLPILPPGCTSQVWSCPECWRHPPFLGSFLLSSLLPFSAWLPRALPSEQIEFSKWLLQVPEEDWKGMSHIRSTPWAGVPGSWWAAGVLTVGTVVGMRALQARVYLESLTSEDAGTAALGSAKRRWVSSNGTAWQVGHHRACPEGRQEVRLGGVTGWPLSTGPEEALALTGVLPPPSLGPYGLFYFAHVSVNITKGIFILFELWYYELTNSMSLVLWAK